MAMAFCEDGRRGAMGWMWPLAIALAAMLTGCDGSVSSPPTRLEGAWLGAGIFRAGAGNADVTAQLELLSDGTYRMLILKPAILAMTGPETGAWSRDGQTLTLTPGAAPATATEAEDEAHASAGVFQKLRSGSSAGGRTKTLTIAGNLSDLRLVDGPLELTFTPNPDATAKLQAAGDVAAP